MNVKLNFFQYMHKQIIIQIYLTVTTALGYIYMGWIYTSVTPAIIWYLVVLLFSFYGYRLYKEYQNKKLTIKEKEKWLNKSKFFLFFYFSLWTVMFVISILSNEIELHYIAIATQLGASVVSATLLVSQRKMAYLTLISLMLPLAIYFLLIGEFYSYLLSIFTLILCGVLMYAAYNTNSYLLKSKKQAYNDYLTKLPNRHYFIELLDDAIQEQRKEKKYIFLLLVDLDHFKTVNDSLGHDIGDDLLVEVANRMDHMAYKIGNNIARLGGDEFCILSKPYTNEKECQEAANNFSSKLLKSIKDTYFIQEHHIYISASIGISIVNSPEIDANTFLKEADIAMYEAKRQGRDGVILFNDELSLKVERKLEIERMLHFALQEKEIYLNYQPQVDSNGKIIGCEVLVRWNSKKLGIIAPDEFIPLSENSGLIIELGYFILEESFKTFKEWDEKGIKLEQFSINISMRQMFHKSFIENVQTLSKKYLSDDLRSKVLFEITETSIAEDVDTLIQNMNSIKYFGINFSLDDFGTGYSSLSYLQNLPINELKIDKSFVSELDINNNGENMVKTILDIAKNLNLVVVAEGVEEASQKEFLTLNSCNVLQGYYFSKPVSKEDFEALHTTS